MAKGVEMEDTLYGNPYAEFGRLDSENLFNRVARQEAPSRGAFKQMEADQTVGNYVNFIPRYVSNSPEPLTKVTAKI